MVTTRLSHLSEENAQKPTHRKRYPPAHMPSEEVSRFSRQLFTTLNGRTDQ